MCLEQSRVASVCSSQTSTGVNDENHRLRSRLPAQDRDGGECSVIFHAGSTITYWIPPHHSIWFRLNAQACVASMKRKEGLSWARRDQSRLLAREIIDQAINLFDRRFGVCFGALCRQPLMRTRLETGFDVQVRSNRRRQSATLWPRHNRRLSPETTAYVFLQNRNSFEFSSWPRPQSFSYCSNRDFTTADNPDQFTIG